MPMNTVFENELLALIRDYLYVCLPKQKNASPHTIRSYRKTLDMFVDYLKDRHKVTLLQLSINMWTRDNICGFLDYLETERGCCTTTRNHRLHCLRAFIRYASEMHPTLCAYRVDTLNIPNKKARVSRLLDYLSEDKMGRLLALPKTDSKRELRNRMILTLLYDTAARVQELLNIHLCDLSLEVPATVTLFGKGSKTRCVPLADQTPKLIRSYLAAYHSGKSGSSKDPLLYTDRSGVVTKMTPDAIRRIVRHYGAVAHSKDHSFPSRIHPHLFRHTRAMHWYKGGVPLPIVSELLGHATIETTQVYAHADTEMKRKAIAAAIDSNKSLGKRPVVFKETDEAMIKKLCGLA